MRDNPQGLGIEVLLLKKNANISFGGSWVFPGGRVDSVDQQTTDTFQPDAVERATVVRECFEESGLQIATQALTPIARWVTPVIRPKRFSALFFLYNANDLDQTVRIDHGEIVDAQWATVTHALDQHQTKRITLAGPAFVSLSQLANFQHTKTALKAFSDNDVRLYKPRIQLTATGAISLYHGDAAYHLLDDHSTSSCADRLSEIENASVRHRLYMHKKQPWQYQSGAKNGEN